METEKSLETDNSGFAAKQYFLGDTSPTQNSKRNLLSHNDKTTKINLLKELDVKHKTGKDIKDYENLKEITQSVLEKLSETVEKAFKFIEPDLPKKDDEIHRETFAKDLKFILYNIVYALIESDVDNLNKLSKDSLLKDISESNVKLAIQKMKDVILEPFLSELNSRKELTISTIQELYPKQWVTIKTTKYINGFPFQGKILFFDSDIDKLTDKISQMTGDIYTFFTSSIDENAEPIKTQSNINNYLTIIESHFDRIKDNLTK